MFLESKYQGNLNQEYPLFTWTPAAFLQGMGAIRENETLEKVPPSHRQGCQPGSSQTFPPFYQKIKSLWMFPNKNSQPFRDSHYSYYLELTL